MANGDLEIFVWDVAHGISIAVNAPNGRTLMLDAGASDNFSPAEWLRNVFHVQQLDALLLSHQHADHLREISKVWSLLQPRVFYRNNTVPRPVIYGTNDPPSNDPHRTFEVFDRSYTNPVPPDLELGEPANWGGLRVRWFFNRGDQYQFVNVNNYSVVTVMDYAGLKFVFPGDLEAPGWAPLMANSKFVEACISEVPQYRVLVASHHGHRAGYYKPFVDLLQPDLTIISGPYGDEHTEAETYRAASGGLLVLHSGESHARTSKVLTTKVNDYVYLRLDGQSNNLFVTV